MLRLMTLLILMAIVTVGTAQTVADRNETLTESIPGFEKPDSLTIGVADSISGGDVNNNRLTYEEQIRILNAQYRMERMGDKGMLRTVPEFSVAMPVAGLIASWDGGGVFGATSMTSIPGLMGVESGRIGLYQNFGRFSFTAYAAAEKYGYLNGLDRTVGFGGSLSFQASDRISFTVFGSYYSPLRDMRGAQAGYIAIPTFGGYMDYSFNDHWGVQVGAQSYRSSATGEWHPQPIVKPYYRVNKNATIGMDVGGILYNLLYYNREKSSRRMLNPTIPIPKMGTLPVGPRE